MSPHHHQCPRPSCRYIWTHSEPTHGFISQGQFNEYHTCPKCHEGFENFKCDELGIQRDLPGFIVAYEAGELDEPATVELFQRLINTGVIHHLQGSYGRTAHRLIVAGLVSLPT